MRNFCLIYISIILSGCSSTTTQNGGLLPSNRKTDWTLAGTPGGIPTHSITQVINITDPEFGANPNDGIFDDDAMQSAIVAASIGSKNVIFIPAGQFDFNHPIILHGNIVLKGEGSDKSSFVFNHNGANENSIQINGSADNQKTIIPFEINAGTLSIRLTDLNVSANDFVELYQGIDEWGSSSSGNKKFQKGQILKVKSYNGENITFTSPVRLNYDTVNEYGEKLYIRKIIPIGSIGIEDLTLSREDTPNSNTGGSIVSMRYAAESWISGVESTIGANHHVQISHCKNIEIRGSYFHHAYNYGGGGAGYGLSIGGLSTDCLVEDNIFQSLRHSMIIQTSSNGNVFGYNASFDHPINNWDEASLSVHGHYAYMNLFEGNYAEYANVDFVWGKNGPFNTFFRNYIYGEQSFQSLGILGHFEEIEIEESNEDQNIVANLALPKIGRGSKNIFESVNYKKNDLPESAFYSEYSFYYGLKPNFISNSFSWPPLGPRINLQLPIPAHSIPAKERLSLTKLTVSAAPISN